MSDSVNIVVAAVRSFIETSVKTKKHSVARVQSWLDGLQYMDSSQGLSVNDLREIAIRDLARTIGGLEVYTSNFALYPGLRIELRNAIVDAYDLAPVRPAVLEQLHVWERK